MHNIILRNSQVRRTGRSRRTNTYRHNSNRTSRHRRRLIRVINRRTTARPITRTNTSRHTSRIMQTTTRRRRRKYANTNKHRSHRNQQVRQLTAFSRIRSLIHLPCNSTLQFTHNFPSVIRVLNVFLQQFTITILAQLFHSQVTVTASNHNHHLSVTRIRQAYNKVTFLHTFHSRFRHIRRKVIKAFLILLNLLPFLRLLKRFNQRLQNITLIRVLRRPFKGIKLTIMRQTFTRISIRPINRIFRRPSTLNISTDYK